MIKNIIWDFDGTLFDTYPAIAQAFLTALNELGKDAPLAEIEALAKASISGGLVQLAEQHGLEADALEQAFVKAYANSTTDESPPFPHTRQICEYIVANGGKNVIITHRRKAGMEELLEAYDLTAYFSGWYTHDDGFPRKPDPTVFLHAIDAFDLDVAETINLGDRELDILAGQGAGVFSGLLQGDPGESTPDLRFDDYAELFAFIQKENAG